MHLTTSQKWLAGAFIVSIFTLGNTLFLSGDIQTFMYIVIGICFAFFAIVMGNQKSKNTE